MGLFKNKVLSSHIIDNVIVINNIIFKNQYGKP